jgi:multisubunit Na+/H+ antiporter MnhC subunit
MLKISWVVAAVLASAGLCCLVLRRSLIGALVGLLLVGSGSVLATVAIATLKGPDAPVGQLAAAAVVGIVAALAIVVLAVHDSGPGPGATGESERSATE